MLLQMVLIEPFVEFVQETFGVSNVLREEKSATGEYGRWMVGDRLFVIRDHGAAGDAAETVEVFCSDRRKLEELERTWFARMHAMSQFVEDESNVDRRDDSPADG